ncbi:hypothetical protein, partial [Dokdonella sp.]|uniref:hypothetical protein n=1 Tax=Dokdonella sp. TaxID=2291710 RepID=UPI00352736B8
MADVESKVLERELGKLGGFAARWSAKLLPNVAHEAEFRLNPSERATSVVASSLTTIGKPISELPSVPARGIYYALVGSGHLNLNPTVLRVKVEGQSVFIRGVAKEGAIKQHSAR